MAIPIHNLLERLVAIILIALPWNQAAFGIQQDEQQRLVDYLDDMHLRGLSIEARLAGLNRESNREKRSAMAREIVAEYQDAAFQLGAKQIAPSLELIKGVIQEFPELNQVPLQIALVQTEFDKNFTNLLQVWKTGRDTDRRFEQSRNLQRLVDEIVLIQERIEQDWRVSRLDRITNSKYTARYDFDKAFFQATNLEGWLALTKAIATERPDPEAIDRSMQKLRMILSISADQTLEVWLKNRVVDNSWQYNAMLGLAIANLLQHQDDNANLLFEAIRSNPIDRDLSEQLPAWRLKSFVMADRQADAEACLLQALEQKLPSRQQRLLNRAAIEVAEVLLGQNKEEATRFAQIGVAQLLIAEEWAEIEKLESKTREVVAALPLLGHWMRAAEAFQKFKKSRMPGMLELAANEANEMVKYLNKDAFDAIYLSACWLLHAEIAYSNSEFETASQSASQAIKANAEANGEWQRLQRSEWVHVMSLARIARTHPETLANSLAELDAFSAKYATSVDSATVSLERLQLTLTKMPPEESRKVLERKILEQGYSWQLGYLSVEETFRWWNSLPGDAVERQDISARLESDYSRLISDGSVPKILKLRTAMLWHRVASIQQGWQSPTVRQIEADIATWTDGESAINSTIAEGLVLLMSTAIRKNDFELAGKLAGRILADAIRQDLRESAYVAIAKQIDKAMETFPGQRDLWVTRAIENYQKMLNDVTDDELSARQNLQVSAIRLAEHLMESNQYPLAKGIVDRLMKLLPDNNSVLQEGAKISVALGDFPNALTIYRKLAEGSLPGSESWLLAKLGVISCLRRSDPEKARSVFDQTLQLAPNMSEEWKSKFHDAVK